MARSPASDMDAVEPNHSSSRSDYLAALDTLSVPQLNEVIREAERLKSSKLDAARSEFLNRVMAESEQLGLDLGSLFQEAQAPKRGRKAGGSQTRGNVAPKYRGPNGEEWSGRGRLPKWVQVAEAEGKSRDEFLIGKQSAS